MPLVAKIRAGDTIIINGATMEVRGLGSIELWFTAACTFECLKGPRDKLDGATPAKPYGDEEE